MKNGLSHLRKNTDRGRSEKMVGRKTSGPKTLEVTRDWRKMQREELHGLQSSNISQVLKLEITEWEGHAARSERGEIHRVLVRKPGAKESMWTI